MRRAGMVCVLATLVCPAAWPQGDGGRHYLVPGAGGRTSEILSAPHVGATLCVALAGTRVRLLSEARHGPHRYARVVLLEGACEGVTGFAPLGHVSAQPLPPGR